MWEQIKVKLLEKKNRPYTNNNGSKRERGACGTNGLSSPYDPQ